MVPRYTRDGAPVPMGKYSVIAQGVTYQFPCLAEVLAKASPPRSGDQLAGLAAESMQECIAARLVLSELPLKVFLDEPLIPYEADEVTRLILDSHEPTAFAPISGFTVGQFRDWLLSYEATGERIGRTAPGITPEMAAAVSKLMRNQDLMLVASKINVITRFRNTIGERDTLSVRLQPNHPTDTPEGIVASTLDGLLNGAGDATVGINPATDDVNSYIELTKLLDDLRNAYEIPMQSCVLAHVTTALEAINQNAPVDLVFQSIAGTQAANKAFGIDLAILQEAHDAAKGLNRGTIGNNLMYFETGQGSALSADAHHNVDQQTVEARAYAVARAYDPLLVNTVVGFIGPEYLVDGKQITRAGLEDHFCGKLLGLPMGCDVCYTNHAEADQDDMDNLLTLLTSAGCNFVMGIPGADDIMLGYQSTSFHDANYVRQLFGKAPAPEFDNWLKRMGIFDQTNRLCPPSPTQLLLDHAENL